MQHKLVAGIIWIVYYAGWVLTAKTAVGFYYAGQALIARTAVGFWPSFTSLGSEPRC